MTAPIVTPLWDSWAHALADSFAEVSALRGDQLDREQVYATIRACLMEPVRFDPRDDFIDPDPEDMPNVPGYLQGRDL